MMDTAQLDTEGLMIPSPAEITALRHAYGENLTAFAARISCSPSSIVNWERGEKIPSRVFIRRLQEMARARRDRGRGCLGIWGGKPEDQGKQEHDQDTDHDQDDRV